MTRRVVEPVCRGLRVVFIQNAITVQLRTWFWWQSVYTMKPDSPRIWALACDDSAKHTRRLVARLSIDEYLRS
jgi:hypothetical protein